MAKKKVAKKPKDIVYDDDDSSGEDEEIFTPDEGNKVGEVQSEDDEELEIEEEEEDDESEEDDSDDEDSEVDEFKKQLAMTKMKETEAKAKDLSAALDAVADGSDDDDDEEDEDEEEEDSSEESEEEEQPQTQVRKRKQETTPLPPPAKKKAKDLEQVDDQTRKSIRDELRQMSLEEIQALKEKLGLKAYNAALGRDASGKTSKNEKKFQRPQFKRENKNRPREMSSKKTVPRLRDVVGASAEQNVAADAKAKRDPRFEATSGDFDRKVFRENYRFVDKIRSRERDQLKRELQDEEDEERREQIKYLIQRFDNQERERQRSEARLKAKQEERQRNVQLASEGKAPRFAGRRERRNAELVSKYEEVKSRPGGLEKYLEKKGRRREAKERRRMKAADVL